MHFHKSRIVLFIIAFAFAVLAAFGVQTRRVDSNALKNAGKEKDTEWLTYGHSQSEQRYSSLKQIDTSNVARLSEVWSQEIGQGGGPQEATPLFANGILYGITNWSVTFAIDARTRKELWRYDPQVNRTAVRLCCGVISRGIALYEGKVIVPVVDGRLVALDAANGKVLWTSMAVPKDNPSYSVTMAPRIMKGKILIGNAGAEFVAFRGYLAAFDPDDGKELWRFYTVPGDPSKGFENKAMEAAAKTWSGEWWKYGGGGSIWDGMAFDPDTNMVYVGVGNGLPWPYEVRQGKTSEPRLDNLYITSILGIDVDSGQLKWHYQCTPGDEWDYDAIQHLMLADLRINNRNRKVIMQVNKNGYFYVLDRTNGQFISAEPVAPVSWAKGHDAKGRPIFNPDAFYSSERGVTVAPLQAHNTAQMAFNPNTGLVYVPMAAAGTFNFTATANFQVVPGQQNLGLRGRGDTGPAPPMNVPQAYGPVRPGQRGILSAWDPATQKERWFAPGGGQSGGGALSTAGNLVFQVTPQGQLRAYSADKGEKLLDIMTGQTAGMGPPMTFMLDGKQYVALMGGQGPPQGRGGPPRGAEPTAGAAQRGNAPAGPAPAAAAPQLPKLYVFAVDGGK